MEYVIGFDFGTHQTKICIQDATNPAEKTYEFFKFNMPDGSSTMLLPSIVQINKDHTISYGYVDADNCLKSEGTSEPKPSLRLIEEPAPLVLPKFQEPKEFPPKPKFDPWLDNLRKLKGEKTDIDKWNETCESIKKSALKKWEKECNLLKTNHDNLVRETREKNDSLSKKYAADLERWQRASITKDFIFRYFKLHALCNKGEWPIKDFSSKEISTWYVGYILLLLQNQYGDDHNIQFGVPCGASNSKSDYIITQKTYEIFIAAYDLIKNFENVKDYLSATFEHLRSLTHYRKINDDIINQYRFDDLPEAFAGLVAVTLQNRFDIGFHLLVDIGGGTTDFALFSISKDLSPDVLHVTSLTNGINGILEETQKLTEKPMNILQEEFLNNRLQNYFTESIENYKTDIIQKGKEIIKLIRESFIKSYRHHGLKFGVLDKSLKNLPVVYAGGGGSFKELHTEIEFFNDIRKIDRNMLSIRNLITQGIDDKLFTILATSYGLASYEKPYEGGIQCTDIMEAFLRFIKAKRKDDEDKYKYVHGLTDMQTQRVSLK